MRIRPWLTATSLLLAALLATPHAQAAGRGGSVPRPDITTPPDGSRGHALWDSWFDLAEFGYEEQEYFVSGTATAADGRTAPYTTRIIVFRPDTVPGNGPEFSGVVLMDWVNVTAQFENAVDSVEAHEYLLREGHAWVHVSAQAAGLDSPVPNPLVPKKWDPVRYAAISHPGDEFSFSMFSQIARALRTGGGNGTDPMGELEVEHVLAAGQSQSASRLTDYIADHQRDDKVIDGFLVHGTFGHDGPPSSPVPVIHLESDADVSPTARSNPDGNVVLWEVAGTAHSDFWIGYHSVFGHGPRSQLSAPKVSRAEKEAIARTAGNYGEQLHPMLATCTLAGATMPMHHATSAAIDQLVGWVRSGTVPPSSDKIVLDRFGSLVAGEHGNAQGGIRLAPIAHPVATYLSDACQLGGITVPFTDVQLLATYGSHQAYYEAFAGTIEANVADGWLLPEDAADLLRRACDARNRFGGTTLVPAGYCQGDVSSG
jgi:hypothetical protein